MVKSSLRRFAPFGLYLALAAALAAGGLFIVQHEFNLYLKICLGLVVIGLALFAILDPVKVRESLTGRQARYGSNALIIVLAFVGIVVVVNYIAYAYPKRWDLTGDKQHTLAKETIQMLQALPQKVTAVAFFSPQYSSDQAKSMLEDFKYNSNGNFDYKFVDPVANPVAAQNAKITQDGTIVLEMGGKQDQVTVLTEQDLDTGLIKLTNPGPRTVYFLTGHGEHDPNGSDTAGYSQARQALESKNYTVKTLNLIASPQIPSDALAIVIAGPTKPVSANEVKLLQDYVTKGGSLVVMEEPVPVTNFGSSPDPLAEYLSQTWNITLKNDIIVDLTSDTPSIAVAVQYGSHPITSKLPGMVSILPTARSVQANTGAPSTETITTLASTSQNSWGETNFTDLQNNKVAFDQNQDVQGPVSLAVAAENSGKKGRVVVFGDADFASDNYFSQYANGDLFINSVDWAAEQENLINLTPKTATQRFLISPQRYVMNMILLGSVFVLPGVVLFSGVLVWVQRRRRG